MWIIKIKLDKFVYLIPNLLFSSNLLKRFINILKKGTSTYLWINIQAMNVEVKTKNIDIK